MRIAVFLVAVFALSASAMAQQQRDVVRADDSHAIQSCIKEKDGKEGADRCIGIVANPCLDSPAGQSTHGQADCYRREHAVWDDILNETYRRLQGSFEGKLKAQLRDVQRSWIEARKLQCGFYVDVIQGSLAIPTSASCMNTETARRALYLLSILNI